jgi:hypothetical protein
MQTTDLSFAEDVQEKLGRSKRYVQRAIRRHNGLAEDVRDLIATTWLATKGSELDALVKLPADEQRAVVDLLLEAGDVAGPRSVGAAVKANRGVTEPPLSPEEKQYRALMAVWAKNPHPKARTRFLAEVAPKKGARS